ncbi:prostaglandin reductase 1-like isoform X2 [Cylas formicarius]|uniref:prostaglandin reductase 1-like isoform X2 n=1 Tax=Cylas formicarius TaxID=197179 RepID=UPI0029585C18|nr:prostaglandin reductase 1-like isoform X2 [Cylas formicarius]
MVKSKVFIFRKHFDGLPKPGDLELVEEELPPLKDGECLVEAVYLSVDPYMRAHAPNLRLDTPFIGSQVAIIKESKNSKFPVGKYITGMFGWRTHSIVSDATIGWPSMPTYVLPDFGKLPISLALGALGTPGNTAYLGFLEICQPKSGETVVVSGAAGAVGNQVGQIAKIKGCKVIGIAGSDEKGKWLVDDLKFDHFINYKTQNVDEALKELAPEGIDCYFDNVGGEISTIVLNNMNAYGRVSVCGSISGYNDRSTKGEIQMWAASELPVNLAPCPEFYVNKYVVWINPSRHDAISKCISEFLHLESESIDGY